MKIKSFDNHVKIMSLSSPKKKRNITNETNCFQDCVIATIVPTLWSLNEDEVSPENNETSKISRKNKVVRNKMFAEFIWNVQKKCTEEGEAWQTEKKWNDSRQRHII